MIELRVDRSFPRRALIAAVAIEIAFVALYALDTLAGQPVRTLHVWFDLNSEVAIPTWFASAQLCLAATVALLLAARRPAHPAPSRGLLILAGFVLLFMSADEGAEIHERIGSLAATSPYLPRFSNDHGMWMPFYLVAIVAIALAVRRPLLRAWRECRAESALVALGAALFLLGAVVLEAISYEYLRENTPKLLRLETGFEEWLEMFGVSLVLYALLRLAARPDPAGAPRS